MAKKIRLGIIFGGRSAEHEVSLQSAKNVIAALDPKKYEAVLIGIDKQGEWHTHDPRHYLANESDPKLIALAKIDDHVAIVSKENGRSLVSLARPGVAEPIDVVFPVLHGTYGEDGTVQGLLKLANIPFVGAGVLGSSIGMDKDVMKRLLRDAKLPIAKFLTVHKHEVSHLKFAEITSAIGLPFFVKPANLGSSVGITKVKSEEQFGMSIDLAFQYDRKVLIEEYIAGRELECSVLAMKSRLPLFPERSFPSTNSILMRRSISMTRAQNSYSQRILAQKKQKSCKSLRFGRCRCSVAREWRAWIFFSKKMENL